MKQKFALDKLNFILIAIGIVIIIAGLLLMTGPSSTETHFEPDIFSTRRIVVAPLVCFVGFVFMILPLCSALRTRRTITDNPAHRPL